VCLVIKEAIAAAVEGVDLGEDVARGAMGEIMSGTATPSQIAAFLVSMRLKGETVGEIAAFAQIMRERARVIRPRVEGRIVDTCGTGGDGLGTFNISTTAMFIASGAGVPIAKHGNRSVSSGCGSADVLENLGARLDLEPSQVESTMEESGVCFMFAPVFHPAMKYAMVPRRELGIRTFFNILGPLTNPCGAEGHVMGIYDGSLTSKVAHVALRLGLKRAFVVHGEDGQDEISTTGKTMVSEIRDGGVVSYDVMPEDFGLGPASIADLRGGDASANARIMVGIIAGEDNGPRRDAALANAAAAIAASWDSGGIDQAIGPARESLESGGALRSLLGFIKCTGGEERVTEIMEGADWKE
jgi:anthranilate phosphoribosyltransferase